MRRCTLGIVVGLALLSVVMAADIGFVETFSLAKDRAASLKQLIPGTEDFYYYHGLHYLQTQQYEKIREQAKPWVERHGETGRFLEIQTRLALQEYDRNPQQTLQFLKHRLGLSYHHEKEVIGAIPNLPTTLDPNTYSRETLSNRSLNQGDTLDNFEDTGLQELAKTNLDWRKRRLLLQRLTLPDVAGLVGMINEDLGSPNAGAFGSMNIHRQLTLKQLEELLRFRPSLLNQQAFVFAWIARLHPTADELWRHNNSQAAAYFQRLWTFVSRLNQTHNSLKSQVLYHWLALERNQGRYDLARFKAYLQLPRFQHYMSKAMLENDNLRRYPADLNANYQAVTLLPAIGSDEALVRTYLKHFFVEANSPAEFEPYINDIYLRHLFAETKIELGLGDPEQWASQLPPEQFKALKERVDIDFAYTIPSHYTIDQPVKLEVNIKNVPTLLVKVFEINTNNFYRQNNREVNTDINLDGLVPNQEMSFALTDPPLRRISKSFDFPMINKPGVYVVDFIGGGKSSRALIRKGKYQTISRIGSAGHVLKVLDEARQLVKNAKVCLAGQEYAADQEGEIIIPFSTQPGRKPIIVTVGDFASLDFLDHQAESYALTAGIFVDRESMLTQRLAKVLVRPSLKINGIPQSLKLLSNIKLRLVSTDQDGISSSTEVPEFKVFEDRDSSYEFRIPPRMQSLQVTLTAEVKALSTGATVALADAQQFQINSIDLRDFTDDLHLAKFGDTYVIEVLGKTGEPRVDRPVQLTIKHREFREPVSVSLKSDKTGRIQLGKLLDVSNLTVSNAVGVSHTWQLPLTQTTYPTLVHAIAGNDITLPYLGSSKEPLRSELAFLEMRGNTIVADRFDMLRVQDGLISIGGIEAGDFDLVIKNSNSRVRIRVGSGKQAEGYIMNPARFLELPPLKPVAISQFTVDAEGNVNIQLKNWTKTTRVHLFGTRYLPAHAVFNYFSKIRGASLVGLVPGWNESTHITGRDIGDEYRYVLDRKGQKKFPGNMLQRPELLLNPWALRSTETTEQLPTEGGAFGAVNAPAPAMSLDRAERAMATGSAGIGGEVTSNLDFLAFPTSVAINLTPDDQGVIKISKKDFGKQAWLHVVALDAMNTATKSIAVAEEPTNFLDLRLRTGLDPKGHFTQQKQISILSAGQEFTIADINNSRFEMYDQFGKLFTLFRTISNDPKLTEFAFLLNWPSLKPEEKRTHYSKNACHELSFFLYKRDPEFFNTVIKPYLANKKDKTFMDHWLLGNDLAVFLEPWSYARLNIVERVLLAQRIKQEQSAADRHLTDLFRMLPPDLERMMVLFDTSVKGNDLSAGSVFSMEKAKAELADKAAAPMEQRRELATPMGMPGGGMGGMGGGGGRPGSAAPGAPAINAANLAKEMKSVPSKGEGRMSMRRGASKDAEMDESRQKRDDAKKTGYVGEIENFYRNERERAPMRQLFRKLEPTQEWAENNYYKLPIEQQLAELVSVNGFWLDYVKHPGTSPFFSKNFPQATRNFTEMMFALSVLELPFEAGKHEMKFEAGKMTLKPASPVVAFHEEVRPAVEAKTKLPILVSQNFYRPSDRYREENGERIDHFITGEFIVHTVYGCQVVVTNPTSSRQKLTVLYQIPVGAMPLGKGQQTKSVLLDLEPYRTQTIDYLFYFPAAGQFNHFPVHIAKNEQYLVSAAAQAFNVVEKPSKIDTESWDFVSQDGTSEQVLALMNRENLFRLNLEKIAFRMKDKAFFEAVTKLLRARHVYQNTLWSYAVEHNSLNELREFLKHHDQLIQLAGNGPLVSTPLTIDPVARHHYQHLEYKPLVNARTHALGKVRQIVNNRFHQQYHQFMTMLSYKRAFDDADWLAITYYLLLQDRIEEALDTFSKVNSDKLETKMQYDYCAAYLAFYTEELAKARTIAAKYATHPVDRWRNTFTAITNQLDEVEGKSTKVADKDNQAQQQTQLAATEPTFDFTIDARKINLTWQNIETVQINYYLMDVELLFSRNPFVQQYGSQFSAIKPNFTQQQALPAGQNRLAIDLPKDLVNRNVLVEITNGSRTRSIPYYANALTVTMQENYGQLKVVNTANSKPLGKVYVKVYVRLADGQVKFHKDGYTDLRGRFDYASVSTPETSPLSRFSILVLSDEFGALIREANPPVQ